MKYLKLFESVKTYEECSHEEYAEKLLGVKDYEHLTITEYSERMWEAFTDGEIEYLKRFFKVGQNRMVEGHKLQMFGGKGMSVGGMCKERNDLVFPSKEMDCGWNLINSAFDTMVKGICYITHYSVSSDGVYVNTHGYGEKTPKDGIIKNPYMKASIFKFRDGWYYVGFDVLGREQADSVYKCDQWDSVKQCLNDKIEWLGL